MRGDLSTIWPFFGIGLRTLRLELRLPTDDELVALARLAAEGVHDPDFRPFETPWTDLPPGEMERQALQFHWRKRAEWSPERWGLEFAVWCDGELVGMQGVEAEGFAVTRSVATGSWLGQPHQGKGIGKEMRAAVLAFAFEGLGATLALSTAFDDNNPSRAVSLALGYEQAGHYMYDRNGEAVRSNRYQLTREGWEANRYCAVEITGLNPCLSLLGVE